MSPLIVFDASGTLFDGHGAFACGLAPVWTERAGLPHEPAELAPRRVIDTLADLVDP